VFYDHQRQHSKTPRASTNSNSELMGDEFGNPHDLYSQAETDEVSPE